MRGQPARALARLAVVLGVLGVAYLAVVTGQVLVGAKPDVEQRAGAIIVLGAAQYDGVPSPALERRLRRALALWENDVAPLVVVTGGHQPGDRFDEATAGRTWLHQRDVPERHIRREVHGRNSYDQLAASQRFLREEGVEKAVLVSHRFHATRLRLIADEVGLEATVAVPRRSDRTLTEQGRLAAREVAAVGLGQVIGFRRLRNLEEAVAAAGG
jgi:uncharacterized SAM-binding protein YcdF (DUF218 family)